MTSEVGLLLLKQKKLVKTTKDIKISPKSSFRVSFIIIPKNEVSGYREEVNVDKLTSTYVQQILNVLNHLLRPFQNIFLFRI